LAGIGGFALRSWPRSYGDSTSSTSEPRACSSFATLVPVKRFESELVRRLPFDAQLALCEGTDVLALESRSPFQRITVDPDHVRFVSILIEPVPERLPAMPLGIPSNDDWYVRIVGRKDQFVFGVYRRHVKTISYLGQIDKALGVPVTTRNWNTVEAVLKVLKT
jgi:uncharacterized protein (DUF1697 family)